MDRPNLPVFMTDQQRADSIGAFGNMVASTPDIDALARQPHCGFLVAVA